MFRYYEIAISRELTPPDVEAAYVELRDAAILVGNIYEELGILLKNGIIDRTMFLDRYSGAILGSWKRLENYTALGREASGLEAAWDNFEYLAVLSDDWIKQHPTSYPKDVRRMAMHNPWPVLPMPENA